MCYQFTYVSYTMINGFEPFLLTVKIISPGILFHILVEHDLNVVFHIVIWRIVMPGLVSHVLMLQFKHELQSFLFHWLIDSLFKWLIRLTNTKDTPSKPGITASLWEKSTGVFPVVSRIKVEYAHVITLSRSLPSLSPFAASFATFSSLFWIV